MSGRREVLVDTAEFAAGRALRRLLDHPVGAARTDLGETGQGSVTLTSREVPEEPAPVGDAALPREGWATMTGRAARRARPPTSPWAASG